MMFVIVLKQRALVCL